MFYSIATQHCVMKINAFVVDDLATGLSLLDENNRFDKLHKMSPEVLTTIENMETQEFGFTPAFKKIMLEQFSKLKNGDTWAIVDDYLAPSEPPTKFWLTFLREVNSGTDQETARELADAEFNLAVAEKQLESTPKKKIH